MKIDGKALADKLLTNLTDTVTTLKKADITPTLAVILVGNDPGSLSYIRQKQKAAERIGAKLTFEQLPETISVETLRSAIAHYNNDPSVHGLIIQRPVPIAGIEKILDTVAPGKDVDGFIPHSPFEVPVAIAVERMLEYVHEKLVEQQLVHDNLSEWLKVQQIAILGRGETAGKPIANALRKYDCATSIIHSQTEEPKQILKKATVIVSCVGKEHIIKKHDITRGVILISVGFSKESDGKPHGDYEEEEIEKVASFYTPTPGGVGPLNVACLMQNLVDATVLSIKDA